MSYEVASRPEAKAQRRRSGLRQSESSRSKISLRAARLASGSLQLLESAWAH
jgi:hypothetical protein